MSPRTRLFVALVSTALVGYVALGSLLGRVLGDTTYGQLAIFNEVVRLVRDSYVEPIDMDRAMNGAKLGLTEALDGDSAYLDDEEFRALQQPSKDTAEVGALLTRRLSYLMVVSARDGSPAHKAGMRPGDVIKNIDGRYARFLPAPVGQHLLRGAPGSVVKLTVLRPGSDPLELSLVRERPTPVAPSSKMLKDAVGYVKVPEFAPKVAEEVRGEIEGLRKAGALKLVLDLRGSGHGVPAEGVKVAELFLKGGTIGKLSGAKIAEQVFTGDASHDIWDRPLAVLVDNGTAGGAEVVAAAILDAGRAQLVGEHTFGRACTQKMVPLEQGGLLITVGKYTSPKGTAIHGKGLTPTVPVEGPDEDEAASPAPAAAPAGDPILDKALEVLRGGEVKKAA
jgi:carboxyl-terminal processing protease